MERQLESTGSLASGVIEHFNLYCLCEEGWTHCSRYRGFRQGDLLSKEKNMMGHAVLRK